MQQALQPCFRVEAVAAPLKVDTLEGCRGSALARYPNRSSVAAAASDAARRSGCEGSVNLDEKVSPDA
jgi:hypothetical protein